MGQPSRWWPPAPYETVRQKTWRWRGLNGVEAALVNRDRAGDAQHMQSQRRKYHDLRVRGAGGGSAIGVAYLSRASVEPYFDEISRTGLLVRAAAMPLAMPLR